MNEDDLRLAKAEVVDEVLKILDTEIQRYEASDYQDQDGVSSAQVIVARWLKYLVEQKCQEMLQECDKCVTRELNPSNRLTSV